VGSKRVMFHPEDVRSYIAGRRNEPQKSQK
jgi:hypothetical protein